MNTQIPFYVISAEREVLSTQENGDRSNWLGVLLRDAGLQFDIALGSYVGRIERSFIVYEPALQFADIGPTIQARMSQQLQRLARLFNQDSYIYVDANRFATLQDKTGKLIQHLGTWYQIEPSEFNVFSKSWTKTADGRYWTAA